MSTTFIRLQKTVAYHTQRLAELEAQLEFMSHDLTNPEIGYKRTTRKWDSTIEDRDFSVEQLSACKEKIAVLESIDRISLINDVDSLILCLKEYNKIFQDTIKRKGIAYTLNTFIGLIQEKRICWVEHCRTYKSLNGKEFLHSADTLNLLKHLHELHDESDLDYLGVHRLGAYFDWTYALPYYTLIIRINGFN